MNEYLNPQNLAAALLVVVPVLVFVARVLTHPSSMGLGLQLPVWCDVTTWPRWAQPIVPFVAAAGPVLVTQLEGGVALLPALEAAGAAGFGAIGLYHAAKRVVGAKPAAAETTGSDVKETPANAKPKNPPLDELPPAA